MLTKHLATGWYLLKNEENEAALVQFTEAVKANPKDSKAFIGLGKALARVNCAPAAG